MLLKLHIQNLALIESSYLSFEKGLTVLSGETGAGKSVIVSAIALALGSRADKDAIRYGENAGSIEATFDVSSLSREYKKRYAAYIEDNKIEIFRLIKQSGKPLIKISSKSATLQELKELTAPIAEILGQHANQQLMSEENHLQFLDNFANLNDIKNIVHTKFSEWHLKSNELQRLQVKRDSILKEQELLIFQKKEIEKASITVGESDKLHDDKMILDAARTLMASATIVSDIIESEENSTASLLTLAQKELDKMAQFDKSLEKQSEELVDISYRLRDMKQFIDQYGSAIIDDPSRIEEINLRLDEIYNLKNKYGGSEKSVLETLEVIKQKLNNAPADIDAYIDDLEIKVAALYKSYGKEALSLSDTRKKAAIYLQKLVIKELSELAIDNGGFEIEFIYEDDPNGVIVDGRAVKPTADGLETARILFSANIGEPLKSLVKTASGGEISRVLLALKSAEKKNKKLPYSLLVFDEVDAGIGGRTAIEVGKKIKKLATSNQLLVITHLHQIAREADHHFVAKKSNGKDKRTIIHVTALDDIGKVKELKRMVALPE